MLKQKGFVKIWLLSLGLVILAVAAGFVYIRTRDAGSSAVSPDPYTFPLAENTPISLEDSSETPAVPAQVAETKTEPQSTSVSTNTKISSIDITKLPLGTNKYSTSPKIGYVYSCQTSFNGGGAFAMGPWINQTAGTWDLTKKVEVDGSVAWPAAQFSSTLSSTIRNLATNGLPSHVTGIYPIASSDDGISMIAIPTLSKSTISL